MAAKADKNELQKVDEKKVNKEDFATQMQAIDIIHRMLAHISVLIMEISRQQLSEEHDPQQAIKQKRMYTLEQIINVVHWIQNFNPQNVNIPDIKVPNKLRNLEKFTKIATKEYPKQST